MKVNRQLEQYADEQILKLDYQPLVLLDDPPGGREQMAGCQQIEVMWVDSPLIL